MSTDDVGHSALFRTVAARVPDEYRDAYLEGIELVRAGRRAPVPQAGRTRAVDREPVRPDVPPGVVTRTSAA